MNPERASILASAARHAEHGFVGEYDPRIRTIITDIYTNDRECRATVFHQREMVTIAALINIGVEARLAASLVGENFISLAEPVADSGDFETADGSHWKLPISIPPSIEVDLNPYFVWAIDENGNPEDLENLDPTHETITANRLPADLAAQIGAARLNATVSTGAEDLSQLKFVHSMRTPLTDAVAELHEGKPDAGIRAACLSELDGITVFDPEMNLCVAALVRIGAPPSLAAAIVHQDYAFAAPIGDAFCFPDARPYGHPGANWAPVDLIELGDGTKWTILMADLGPIHNVSEYDAWSLRGKKRMIGNITRANGKPLHDPTRKAIVGLAKYRMMASRFEGMFK